MKKNALIFLMVFLSVSLFAQSGIMWGETDIKYVTTEHFDIIYEPDSADSAALLRENAERILEEIQDFFGAGEIRMRVPVVISSNCQMFNAANGNVPYPLIYLYDTAIDESMAVFSNDLLSTFKHELTHAYTLNMKNNFWNGFSKVMGNAYNPANIFATSGMAESATLTSESSTGEGRLNDEWSLQVARQAKIEGKWPNYYDEQGHSTKYYAGDFYYFNGGFADYLQKTYGMEKYARFWHKCANFQAISQSNAFKKVYGIKIWDAWKDFGESLFVPEYSEPFEIDGVKDFFTNSNEKYSLENNRGAIYRNLSATEKGLYYFDYKSANVYFVPTDRLAHEKNGKIANGNLEKEKNEKEKLTNDRFPNGKIANKKISSKKIFHKSSMTSISVSADGRFIAYGYYDANSANYKHCVAVYDTKTKRHITAGDRLKTPAIAKQGDEYYLLALNFVSQKKRIAVQKIKMKNGKAKGFEKAEYIPLAEGTNVLSFTDIGDGRFAMIVKSGMEWELCFGDIGRIRNAARIGESEQIDDTIFQKITLPEERMTMRYLSYSPSENSVYFSWTKPNSMPRLGKFSLDNEEFILSDKNISGGVYYPVAVPNAVVSSNSEEASPTESSVGGNEKVTIYYIGQFTKQNRIFSFDTSPNAAANCETYAADYDVKDFSEIHSDVVTLRNPADEILGDAKKYNPFRYYIHPVIIPFSSVKSYCFDMRDNYYYGDENPLILGVTTISANPWGKGLLQLSVGIDSILTSYGDSFKSRSYGLSASFASGTDTNLFNYTVAGSLIGDFAGFKQGIASVNTTFNFDWISFSDSANFRIGRSNIDRLYVSLEDVINGNEPDDIEEALLDANKNSDNLLFFDNQFGVTLGKVQVYESELFNKIGGLFNVSLFNLFEKSLTGEPFTYSAINLGASARFYIPKLLPLKCYDRFVYNLPTVLFASAYTNATDFFSAEFKTTVFGYDIQKGIPFLFFDKIYLDAGYQFAFKYEGDNKAGNFEIINIKNHIASLSKGSLPYTDKVFIDFNAAITPNIGMVGLKCTFTFELFYKPHPLPINDDEFGFSFWGEYAF